MLITPELKDKILLKLIDGGLDFFTVTKESFDDNWTMIQSILRQFDDRGFIHLKTLTGVRYTLRVEVIAHDFIARGGYRFEEDIFRNNFTKLELELAKLEKENPKINFDNATTLIGTVAAGIDIYKNLFSK